jgi:large subunit ribosomal protein L18
MIRKDILAKQARAERRAKRVRAKLQGTADRPRLSVFRSHKHISAQLIDDVAGRTLVSANDSKCDAKLKPLDKATQVGTEVAKLATAAQIKQVVFDRGAYLYHGRVKALAEAAREGGLVF